MNEPKWLGLMERLGFDANIDVYRELLACYSQKHRHYHNVSHISAVLNHLEKVQNLTDNASTIELALWFHDAIYKVLSSTNELNSANWAATFLQVNGASKKAASKVHSLIMATLHNFTPADNDEKLMVDIDLAILGCDSDTYELFESWIRKEYRLIPSFVYNKKRKAILAGFLDRDRIYSHDYFYQGLEKSARENISKAIRQL